MIIALSAYAQGGKDTAAGPLIERGFEKRAFADTLRKFAYAVNPIVTFEVGLPGKNRIVPVRYADLIDSVGYEEAKKLDEVRKILQRIGTEGGRKTLYDNVWVDAAMKDMDAKNDYVFTDCRFPNEADAVRAAGGRVVRIERPGLTAVNAHESETALLDYRFDKIINNDGDADLLRERILDYVDTQA